MDIITDYTLLKATSSSSLSGQVQEFVTDGYQPFGSPFTVVIPGRGELLYHQAVVKYAPPEEYCADNYPGPL